MSDISYQDLARQGFRGSADSVQKLLLTYGHDDDAVQALQDGINGYGHDDDGDLFERDGDAFELQQKDAVMADFHSGSGAFAKEGAPPTPGVLKQIRETLQDITARLGAIETKLGILPAQKPGPGQFKL